jgi:hypothetical protein
MAFNHDKKYEHFTQKEFALGKNSGKDFSNKGETSPMEKPVNWKGIRGLEKPWEDCSDPMDTYERESAAEEKAEEKEEKSDGEERE